MPPIHLLIPFLAGKHNLVCIDDHTYVAAILGGRESGLILAREYGGYMRGHAAHDLQCRYVCLGRDIWQSSRKTVLSVTGLGVCSQVNVHMVQCSAQQCT